MREFWAIYDRKESCSIFFYYLMKVFKAIVPWKNKQFSGFPLRLILVVPFVLQIFGAVGLVGYLSFQNGQQAVNELVQRLMAKNDKLIIALFVSIGLGLITSRWITQPILLLKKASVAISQGDLNQEVKVKHIIELEILSDSFNQMARQLKASFASLAQINQQLDRTNEALAKSNLELETKVEQRTVELQKAIALLQQEIAQHQQTQQKLLHQSLHDALTGLPNRILFMEHLQKALQRSQRNENYLFAVLFIDLDRFKIINDTWGHLVGDRLLKVVSSILQECCRQVDIAARLSGDEFIILLEDLPTDRDAVAIAEKLLAKLTAPIDLEEHQVFSGASIGIVFGSASYQDEMELLRDADLAMYRAKALGKGCYAIFARQMS
jgi:diguanylate cyclase (GGDEF)-like protein